MAIPGTALPPGPDRPAESLPEPRRLLPPRRLIVAAVALLALGGATFLWRSSSASTLPTRTAVLHEALARFDADGDGRISQEEWEHHGGGRFLFQAYDFNGDGYIDATEFEAVFTSVDPRPGP